MRKLILIPFLILIILLTSCGVPSSVDHEIKDLIKDIPIPARYNMDTGEKLVKYHITVKEAKDSYNYSIRSGDLKTEYEISLEYDMPFYVFPSGDRYNAYVYYLTFYISIPNTGDDNRFYPYIHHFTLQELKDLKDKLTWEN